MQNSPWYAKYDQEYYPMGAEFLGFVFPVIDAAFEELGWHRAESVLVRSVHVHRYLNKERCAVIIEENWFLPQIDADQDVIDLVGKCLDTRESQKGLVSHIKSLHHQSDTRAVFGFAHRARLI